jgi:hypothetical protein
VAGNNLTSGSGFNKQLVEKIEKELKTDFIPELYDRAMEKMFDDKYYMTEDKGAEKFVNKKDIDMKLMKDEDFEPEIDGIQSPSDDSDDSGKGSGNSDGFLAEGEGGEDD